jgi:hypothetical protein
MPFTRWCAPRFRPSPLLTAAQLPYMAAGANSALMDGVVLGECLRRARSLADIPTALEVFEAINKPRGEWTVRKSLQQVRRRVLSTACADVATPALALQLARRTGARTARSRLCLPGASGRLPVLHALPRHCRRCVASVALFTCGVSDVWRAVLNGFQPYDEVDRRWDALAAEARARREGGARS